MISELVEGERFTTVEPTPRLARCIDGAAESLAAAAPGFTVRRHERISFGDDTTLVPSLLLVPEGQGAGEGDPVLVVEFRIESTSRYVLGPKRLAYSRSSVPELWFVDPWRSRVGRLEAHAGGEYGWPPTDYRPGDALEPRGIPGASVAVADLLSGWPAGVGREPDAGEPWWEAS